MSICTWCEAVVAGDEVESKSLRFHLGEKGRDAGPVSWYRWVIEKRRIGEAAVLASQLMQTVEICM